MLTTASGACAPAAHGPEAIVLIVVDTLRRDALGVYGSTTPTPRIDALAKRGVAHDGLMASFHQTSMSMAALFTGLTPSLESGTDRRAIGWTGQTWCGMARFGDRSDSSPCIPESVGTLGEALQRAGYWTAGVATNPLLFRPAGFHRGFDAWVELAPPRARRTADGRTLVRRGGVPAQDVNEMVAQILATRPGDRLFLYVHFMDVHDYMLTGIPYARMVERVDHAIGQLLDQLGDAKLLDDAAIYLVSDHGETLTERHWTRSGPGHRGNPSYGEQIAVPLIVAPAQYAPPVGPLRTQDLFSWISGIAGAGRKPATSARPSPEPSSRPLQDDEIFLSELHWQTYQHGRFKSHRKRGSGRVGLVDLETDPSEQHDVASHHPDVVAAHVSRMDELTAQLATPDAPSQPLSDEDAEALRQLGYLE